MYHGYSELEKTALASLSGNSAYIVLPAVSEDPEPVSVLYRHHGGAATEERVQPLRVLGRYDFNTSSFNAIDVYVRWPETGTVGPLTALFIVSVRSARRGLLGPKSISTAEWVNSLQIDSSEVDKLIDLRKLFREKFGPR